MDKASIDAKARELDKLSKQIRALEKKKAALRDELLAAAPKAFTAQKSSTASLIGTALRINFSWQDNRRIDTNLVKSEATSDQLERWTVNTPRAYVKASIK